MLLINPTISFSLPSLHDGLVLDCRIYHPLLQTSSNVAGVAVVAHPYAPLGGCYDDPIVDIIGGALLRLGFVVGTFNFRGAYGSAGRTSWSAKPERCDYMSMVGFMAYHVHHLEQAVPSRRPVFIHAGYSYGAMITMQLPPLEEILALFSEPLAGSPAAEIRLRAESLAHQCLFRDSELSASRRRSLRLGIRVGGDECRISSEMRRSLDREERVRRGVHDLFAKLSPQRTWGNIDMSSAVKEAESLRIPPLPLSARFRPAYLLVSPLQGIITSLATMSFLCKSHDADGEKAANAKLVENECLALFGDQDVFVSAHRLRHWALQLESQPHSRFRAHEVSSAGHFWVEGRVAFVLRDAIGTFGSSLIQ